MNDDRLDQLINAWLDHSASDAFIAELESQLLQNPGACHRFWELASLHGLIYEVAQQEWGLSELWLLNIATAPHIAPAPAGNDFSSHWSYRRRRHWPQRAFVARALSVAAAAVFVALGMYFAGRFSSVIPHEMTPASAHRQLQPLATLTAVNECQWGTVASVVPKVGDRITSHQFVELQSGVAQFTFESGAEVYLEGPARFAILSEMHGTLDHGRLLARVPQRAHGFRITTPTMDIVDLGTRFGLEAKQKGPVEVQVVEGLIELAAAPQKKARSTQPQRLTAGQAVIGNSNGISEIRQATNTDRFTRLAAATRNDFSTDPGWKGLGNTQSGNSYGWRQNALGAASDGEIGGRFARNQSESFFGDISLSQKFSLNDAIVASGTLRVDDAANMDGQFFVGHFSRSAADDRREFIGMEFIEGDNDGIVEVRPRLYRPEGRMGIGAESEHGIELHQGAGNYHFEYIYDPDFEADTTHPGPEGKLTLRVRHEKGEADVVREAVLEPAHRRSGAQFDAFGVGIAKAAAGGSDATKTARFYIDDASYSGHGGQ